MNHILKVSRLEGLTDGIFAVAMTILALDLRVPIGMVDLHHVPVLLSDIYLKLFIYGGSFIILGTLWIAMNFQLGLLSRVNRTYFWLNMFYLMTICVIPFSSSFYAAYPDRVSVIFYAINLLCCYVMQLLICEYARIYELNGEKFSLAIRRAIIRRIFIAPPFYIISIFLASVDHNLAFLILLIPTLIFMIPGYVDKFDKAQTD